MAVLTEQERQAAFEEFQTELSRDRDACAVTKADLRAAVDALDAFLDTNAAAINQALPLAARQGLTTAQKARLLIYVVRRRWIAGA